jgi:hypothetical protein
LVARAAKGGGVALASISADDLTIARDDTKVVVARGCPMVNGEMRQSRTGSITDIVAVPRRMWTTCHSSAWARSTVSDSAPGTASALLGPIVGFVVILIVTVAVSRAASPWFGVPVGIVLIVAVATAALRQQDRAERAWRDRHVTLYHARDRSTLYRGRAAVQDIVESWPTMQGLVDVADPTPTLARALWELASLLAHRQSVRRMRDDLVEVAVGLPKDSQTWRDVDERRQRAESEFGEFNRAAARHLAYLTGLADECGRFVAEQRALATARTAVARADRLLGRAAPVTLADGSGAELADRTRAVLAAYRELTNHLGADGV